VDKLKLVDQIDQSTGAAARQRLQQLYDEAVSFDGKLADRTRGFDEMLELGLIGELRQLREAHALDPELPSMRCVGYRQAWAYLDGRTSLGQLRSTGIAASAARRSAGSPIEAGASWASSQAAAPIAFICSISPGRAP
jgi:hypothetical protein